MKRLLKLIAKKKKEITEQDVGELIKNALVSEPFLTRLSVQLIQKMTADNVKTPKKSTTS